MERIAVIGLGTFGSELAIALAANGAEVIAIDRNARPVEAVRDDVTLAVRLDATDENALRAQDVHEVEVAVVGIGGDFEACALTVAVLRGLKVPRILARAATDIQAQILTRIGATEVVQPYRESARRWAHRLILPDLQQYVELSEDHAMVTCTAPKRFHNRTIEALQLRREFGVNVVAIRRTVQVQPADHEPAHRSTVISVPRADTTILPDDTLVIVGSNDALAQLPTD